MSQKLKTLTVRCAAFGLLASIGAFGADTAAAADSQMPPFSADTAYDSAVAAEKRDSTVHAMLAALEDDAYRKALAQVDSALPAAPSAGGASRGIMAVVKQLPRNAMKHRRLLLAALGGMVLAAGALMLAAARRSGKEALRFMTTTRLSLMNSEVQRACLHIEKHYGDPALSPAAVCAAIITGEPFLETLFEKELGMTVGAYINQVRIHRAKLLVKRNPDGDSADLFRSVGFSDEAAFAAQFKAVTGADVASFRDEKQVAA